MLILVVFSQAYVRSEINTQKSAPNLVNYAQALSIAISELHYGSAQSIGYVKILNLFNPLIWGSAGVDWGPEFSIVNQTIQQALNLENVASEGTHTTSYEGLSTYYKLAFVIFGFKAESAFYLYWLFLAVSVLIFLITFYNRPILLFYLLLFTCALLAISQTQGVLIESIVRNRFFSILAVLPSFYLALLISGERKWNWIISIWATVQAFIVGFVAYVRPTALFQILFLISVPLILVVLQRVRLRGFKIVQNRIQYWPLAIVLIGYLLVRVATLNPVVNTVTNRGCTWHMFYMGLGAHPDALEKYNIAAYDTTVFEMVERRMAEFGYSRLSRTAASIPISTEQTKEELILCSPAYDAIVRDEFFKIFQQDPWFVVSSYFYKIPQYFQVYLHPLDFDAIRSFYVNPLMPAIDLNYYNFGVINQLMDWPIVIALAMGFFLVEPVFAKNWVLPLLLLIFAFLWTFLIPILYFPLNNTIATSAMILTMLLLALFSGGVFYGAQFLPRFSGWQNLIKFVYISFMVFLLVVILSGVFNYQPRFLSDQFPDIKPLASETRFYGQPLDRMVGSYKGVGIFSYQNNYYAIPQTLWPLDKNALDECLATGQCRVGKSESEILQLVDQIQTSPSNDVTRFIKTVATSSSQPGFGSDLLLDGRDAAIYAWHSQRGADFPQWIDVVFHHPVTLEKVGLQAQFHNPSRAPHNVVILGVESSELSEIATLTFDFDGNGAWSFRQIPDLPKETRHYRLLILDNHGDPDFVTIQELHLYGQIEPETYKGFDISWAKDKYYGVPQLPWTFNIMQEDVLRLCQVQNQCIVGESIEEIKQQIDKLPASPKNELTSLIKKVTSSSTHPAFGSPGFLFDNVSDPANAWHSDQVPEFPQWIDIEFQEPVMLAWIGLQAQLEGMNQHRAPHNVVVVGGEDPEMVDYKADLQFKFDQPGVWSFQELPGSTEKFQRYRILIMDNHQGEADFVTIQELWLGILIEEGYKGFNILWGNGKFYVLDQTVELMASGQLAEFSPDAFQAFCEQNGRCGLADTLEAAKQLVDQLAISSP